MLVWKFILMAADTGFRNTRVSFFCVTALALQLNVLTFKKVKSMRITSTPGWEWN
jgi:hypothetical protein